MAISFEQFFRAIAEQESGGNYGAVGVYVRGDRAYGKYQVMGANIPSWTRQYLGRSLTPQQYLNSPAAQEKVARGRLLSYFNKYGIRGAASAWYSGNPNNHMSTKPQHGGPSIKGYVDSIIRKAGGQPNTSSGGGGGGGAGEELEVPKTPGETAEAYGFVQALFNSTPELKKLFKKALDGGWTPQKFQAALRDTKWWKTTSASEREYLTLTYGDPKTAQQKLDQAIIKVRQLSERLGFQWTKELETPIKKAAYNLVAKGWDEAQLRDYLGRFVYFKGGAMEGEAGEALDALHEYSYAMGVKNSDQWYADHARNIVRGYKSVEDVKTAIRKQAETLFPQWSKQLQAGQTVADIASPYFSAMAGILELPAGSVNLFDPLVKRALQSKDKVSGSNMVKPLWEFEAELRKDPRWKQTKNAQDSLMQVGHQVLADFGLKY